MPNMFDAAEPDSMFGTLLDRARQTITYGILQSMFNAATLPGDVYAGRVDPTSDEALQRAFDMEGLAMMGGVPAMARAARAGMANNVLMSGVGDAAEKKGITAYHGSPHDFDRFDMSKIGTGEGAQAYGHGLYFAENEGVARAYRDNLAKMQNQMLPPRTDVERDVQGVLAEYIRDLGPGGWDDATNLRHAVINATENGRLTSADALDVFDQMVADGRLPIQTSPGRMYEVRINADPEDFLDWDKPLSEQPARMQDVLHNAGIVHRSAHSGQRGSEIYRNASNPLLDEGSDAAARELRQAGIPGIKYLDQGSRAIDVPDDILARSEDLSAEYNKIRAAFDKNPTAELADKARRIEVERAQVSDEIRRYREGRQTRNYVVFDDALIDIQRKYAALGLPVPSLKLIKEDPAKYEQDLQAMETLRFLNAGGA